jgi:hypothetical protein
VENMFYHPHTISELTFKQLEMNEEIFKLNKRSEKAEEMNSNLQKK